MPYTQGWVTGEQANVCVAEIEIGMVFLDLEEELRDHRLTMVRAEVYDMAVMEGV